MIASPIGIFITRWIFCAICFAVSYSNAQDITPYQNAASSAVIAAAEKFDPRAIDELGIRKDRNAIPILQKIANEADVPEPPSKHALPLDKRREARALEWRNLSHTRAKIALARMGDDSIFQGYVAGLSSTDTLKRIISIQRLGDVEDRRAVKMLIPLLDDHAAPPPHGHVGSLNVAITAVGALNQILPDVEPQFLAASNGKGYVPVVAWKNWWKEHHSEFENLK